jgi:hypothetical protein
MIAMYLGRSRFNTRWPQGICADRCHFGTFGPRGSGINATSPASHPPDLFGEGRRQNCKPMIVPLGSANFSKS